MKKRLKFKKPFNGMDNALKLIPESYKVDGKEFQITDGTETYDVRWDINEATVLRAENKNLINEDLKKMKHLMGFKSQDTLGNLKGAERINENKSFNKIWGKTKRLIKESYRGLSYEEIMGAYEQICAEALRESEGGYGVHVQVYLAGGSDYDSLVFDTSDWYDSSKTVATYENGREKFKEYFESPEDILEFAQDNVEELYENKKSVNEMKSGHAGGMGFSNEGNLEGNEPMAEMEKELDEFENRDVENLFNTMGDMNKIKTLASKINTRPEKIEAAIAYVKAIVGDNEVLQKQIARQLMNDKGAAVEPSMDEAEMCEECGGEQNVSSDLAQQAADGNMNEGMGYKEALNKLSDIANKVGVSLSDLDQETKDGYIAGIQKGIDVTNDLAKSKDRFDEIFEDLYSEEEGEDFPDLTGDGKVTRADILKGRGVDLDE